MSTQSNQLGFSIKNMDPLAGPRQDFYRFAAGGWLDSPVIADTDAQVSDILSLVHRNAADLGGVTLAFHALMEALAGQPGLEEIDGYSPEERFFIAWAQLWMSNLRPEMSRQLISRDPHTPSAFRAIGPLVNVDAFFDTFGIQPGDGMWREASERARIRYRECPN